MKKNTRLLDCHACGLGAGLPLVLADSRKSLLAFPGNAADCDCHWPPINHWWDLDQMVLEYRKKKNDIRTGIFKRV